METSQQGMRETANFPSFVHLEEERRVLQHDYVDDILRSNNDLHELKSIVANVKLILKAGGFFLKPWDLSGWSGRVESEYKPVKIKE